MWSTLKRRKGSQLGHDKRDIPAFNTVSLHSNLGSPRPNYLSIITTNINVLKFGSMASKMLLKIPHWLLKNKEKKIDFRFVERNFLAAINLIESAEEALAPVLLRIKHSSRIFIVMLHLYGAREDTKIWAKIISAHAKKCSRIEVSVAEGRWVGQKGISEQTSWGMNA